MAEPRTYPLPPDQLAKALRQLRRVRQVGLYTLLVPPAIVGLMVLVHRVLIPGVLDPFLDSPPWPYRFFSGLFYIWLVGWLSLFAMKAFVCPNCGNGFTAEAGYDPRYSDFDRRTGAFFRINIFTSRCLNCGLTSSGDLPPRGSRGGGGGRRG